MNRHRHDDTPPGALHLRSRAGWLTTLGMLLLAAALPACPGESQLSPARLPAGEDSSTTGFNIAVRSPVVTLSAAVRDSRGRPVKGLTRDDFRLYDEGQPQALRFFTNEDLPATIGLVIDASRCMRPVWDKVRQAALAFLETSHPEDEYFLILFDERPALVLPDDQPFTSNTALLRSAMAGVRSPRARPPSSMQSCWGSSTSGRAAGTRRPSS